MTASTRTVTTAAREQRLRLSIGALGLVCLLAGDARAADDDCPYWFPDFRCDRQARPDGSVMPMSAPFLFEDPYITTGLNLVGIWHQYPDDSIFEGGDLSVLALQARVAITDWLAFIATKDGFAFHDPDLDIIDDSKGFLNIAVGFKAKAWEWEGDRNSGILTPSLRYEIPIGARDVYQGHDDGIFIPAVSGAYQNDNWHVISALGAQLPVDGDENTHSLFYHVHLDHAFNLGHEWFRYLVPFIELNLLHYIDSGDGSRKIHTNTPLGKVPLEGARNLVGVSPFDGVDVLNLGGKGVGGDDIVTMAFGLRVPMKYGLSMGASYERAISNEEHIFEQRVTFMLTWEL